MRTVLMILVFFVVLVLLAPFDLFTAEKEAKSSKKVVKMKLTATAYYKPVPGQKKYLSGSFKKELRMNGTGTTYSGKKAEVGDVAIDPTVIPLGTKFRLLGGKNILGQKTFKAVDTGGRIKGKKVDFFVGDGYKALLKALEIGKEEVEVEILEWGQPKRG